MLARADESSAGRLEASPTPLKRGYHPPESVRDAVAAAHCTRLGTTTATAVVDHVVALALVVGAGWVVTSLPWPVGVAAVVVAALGVGRQLRALENLVHEASHFNWSRHHRTVNDVLAFALAGIATGAQVRDYRASHLRHHGRFGTVDDPDRNRYAELDLELLPRTSAVALARALLARLPRYQLGWLATFRGSRGAVMLPVAWAVAVVAPMSAAVLGTAGGLAATSAWLLGFLVALPVVRLLGESSEHVYTGAPTVFDATVTNLGPWQRLLLHPHNDGYHTVHHLWPGVPHHQLRRLHEQLLTADPDGYGRRLLARTRLLQHPERLGARASSRESVPAG